MALVWTYESKQYRQSGESLSATHVVTIIDRAGAINGTFCGTRLGATLSQNGPSRNVTDNFISSSTLTFELVITEEVHVDFVKALTDFDERRFIVQYRRNGALHFTGIIFLDAVTTNFINDVRREGALTPAGIFTVNCIDSITLLKDEDYNQGELGLGLPYLARQPINEILGQCFDSLMTYGWGQFIVLRSNWEPDTGGGQDFFQNTDIDNDILSKESRQGGRTYFSKYDIIKMICEAFDLRCYYRFNNYFFEHINMNTTGGATGVYDLDGNPAGTFGAGFFFVPIRCGDTATWRIAPDVRTYKPPLGNVKVIYEFSFNGNFLAGNTWNNTLTVETCFNDLGRVPVPNDTTRMRWAGDVQFYPRDTIATQTGQYQVVFFFKIKVGDQYFVRELADDTLGYYQNFRYGAEEWTTTAGYYVIIHPVLVTLPETYDSFHDLPFFITTLPVPEVLDGELVSACFKHEVYGRDGAGVEFLVSPSDPTTGFAIEHFVINPDLIVVDQDDVIVEKTGISKTIYNNKTNSSRHERKIIFSTGPNKSSDNRLTDDSTPVVDQLTWTGDQGTYPHYELLARTIMSRTLQTQEFLEGQIKGGTSLGPGDGISYDGKNWLPMRYDYISGVEHYDGEWYNLEIGNAGGLADSDEDIFLELITPRTLIGGNANLTPIISYHDGPFLNLCVDDTVPPIPIPDTTGWTDNQIAARIEVYKQAVGSLFYFDPPTRVDEWAWDNDTRCIILGEQIRFDDKLTVRVWVG